MKRGIFIAVLGMASAVAAYGQGYVNFSNYYNSTQTTGITYGNGPAVGLGVGPEISVTLLYGASTDTLISELTPLAYNDFAGDSSPIAAGNGIVSGPGAIPASQGGGWFSGGAVLVPGTPGSVYAFALSATGTYLGKTYNGVSGIFDGATQVSNLVGVPNLPPGLELGSFQVLTVVPEPTTLALAGLGLASLAMLRRKKA
jgi:hypothetical protein